jgi:hypothetical protein
MHIEYRWGAGEVNPWAPHRIVTVPAVPSGGTPLGVVHDVLGVPSSVWLVGLPE